MSTVRCVGAIVHDDAGRLLLIQRAHEPARGRWSLPGGRVEAGESDPDAVVRELREETGLSVRPGPLVGSVARGPYEIFDYACEVAGGRLTAADDAADARWVDAATFAAMERAGELTDGLAGTLRAWNALPRT
ncbi:ADP-ribose pyrophosphatase YjhB (NUDIX family) [Prauserella shujinwangii]|uniref:ADP-ribose pyrophosphatase YjhB (NUDIX family) n=1 Tax=Prauserella shujinwangii TaxID=1453103 RepID=A0A2T0LMB7_9PSEU|nr:NUDIX domain-containing protein [Prauserella shujinwangii]PRX44228.1 ADP-ribose pyrophosphatase YjhB (NUDIX family) [Prauserella shujinwangii]